MYHLDIVCMVQTEEKLWKYFTSLHLNIYDEDDNPPYVNGTDSEDVIIEFNRSEVCIISDTVTTTIWLTF